MKKILMFGLPLVLAGGLLAAAGSFGFHGHHHGMAKEFLEYRLDKLSKELNLNASQQAQMDTFKKDIETIIEQRMEKRGEIHEMVRKELSKENPDLTRIKPTVDQQIDEMAQLGHDVVNRISDFYTTLNPEQKKILSDILVERMEEHDAER